MRYYISDLHFYHESLLTKMDCRGFENCDKMHEYMIERWNKKVRENDEVVILGVVSMERGKKTNDILQQLNGRLFLVKGNHDNYLEDRRFDATRFEWIKPYAELNDNKRKIILSHYPIFCYNGQYRRNKEGNPKTVMMYGHVHDTHDEVLVNEFIRMTRNTKHQNPGQNEPMPIPCRMINTFCMFSDYTPLSLEEWLVLDEKRRREIWENDGLNYCKSAIE